MVSGFLPCVSIHIMSRLWSECLSKLPILRHKWRMCHDFLHAATLIDSLPCQFESREQDKRSGSRSTDLDTFTRRQYLATTLLCPGALVFPRSQTHWSILAEDTDSTMTLSSVLLCRARVGTKPIILFRKKPAEPSRCNHEGSAGVRRQRARMEYI